MEFDLGLAGLGLLIAISLVFGVVAQFVVRPGTRWQWLIAAAAWFVGGLFASEVVVGSLTSDEIQPIIDGLALDEALLGGVIAGVMGVLATRLVTGGGRYHRPTSA